MDSRIVIKVKYGETLRRFNAQVNDGGNLDIDMLRLREKITNLFGFSPETDFTLTYIDEDGDVVTLVDDDDLYDVMNQSLNPLRITVKLNTRNGGGGGGGFSKSGSSTPMRSHQPLDFNGISKVMKSVPEPLRETLSKLSLEVASKASHTGPIIAGLVDSLSKLGQSMNPETPRKNSVSMPVPAQNSDIKQTPVKFGTQNAKESEVNDAVGDGKMKVEKTDGFRPYVIKSINQAKRDSKSANVDGVKATKFPRGPGNSAVSQLVLNPTNESPFQGTGLSFGGPGPCPFKRSYKRNNGMGGSVFHRGIRCDGCGVLPITGLRFKSKVKEDYDLCSSCFTNIGKEDDYLRIDRPVIRRPNLIRELDGSEQIPSDGFQGMINMGGGRLMLDGRFIMDINVLDGTVLAPSTQFTKIWRMTNNGTVSWPRGTELVWIGGDKFSSITRAALQISVEGLAVDKEIDIAVDFCAPEFPGRYISYWRLASPSGSKFGQRVWVLIEVDAALKDPLCERLSGLNLNLPPVSSDANDVGIDMNYDPMMEDKAHVTDDYINTEDNEHKPIIPIVEAYAKKIEGTGYPIFGPWSVGSGSGGSVVFPTKPNFSIQPSLLAVGNIGKSVQPIIDMNEAAPTAPVAAAAPTVTPVAAPTVTPVAAPTVTPVAAPTAPVAAQTTQVADDNNDVELTLLKELEDMGFMEINLNKEILRKNEYDFEQSVDELCGVSEWDPILEELNEMGFSNKEMNKRLLKKNNGSIKRVVLDLIAGEKA